MKLINRVAIVVRPKTPFFDWARSLDGGVPESTKAWTSVYLFEAAQGQEPSRTIRGCFAQIFEEQLEGWHRVVVDWPTPRTIALFQRWFDVEVVDMVFDLADVPLEHDD